MAFLDALRATEYILPLVNFIKVIVGIALWFNFFIPLSLIVLAPISINIAGYHIWLDPAFQSGFLGYLVFGLNIYLAYVYRGHYKALLRKRAEI